MEPELDYEDLEDYFQLKAGIRICPACPFIQGRTFYGSSRRVYAIAWSYIFMQFIAQVVWRSHGSNSEEYYLLVYDFV